MDEVVTDDMRQRSQRLIDVAADMLVSQGVAKRSDDLGVHSLRSRLEKSFHKGRIHGYASALELFYERR
jgi:molecular chaperone DnaJ